MKILSWDIGIINLSYCIIEYNNEDQKILHWGILNLMETDEMKKNRNLLFENIPRKLHENSFLLDVDKVVIENQPSLKNPQMKSIQMIVYSYFLMYGKILNDQENKIQTVDFCNASNKLKVYKGPEIVLVKRIRTKKIDDELPVENESEKKGKKKLSYGDKKKMAVEHVRYFLTNKGEEENKDFFLSHKKKDDLADSYLQALYIINK